MTREARLAGVDLCRRPFPSPGRTVGRSTSALLNSSARYGTLWTCGLGPYTFREVRKDARALRARGLITLLGGHCAERRAVE